MIAAVAAVVTFVGAAATIALEPRARSRSRIAKAAASTGFLIVALASGALGTDFGVVMLVGLCLAWIGDLLLTFPDRSAFLGGLVAFLLGHVAYVVAFAARGLEIRSLGGAGVAVVLLAAGVLPWLLPHVTEDMRAPVIAYTVVISVMLAAAAGTHGADADARVVIGAGAFYLSDLAVARDRFVAPGIINRIWGLPLYYAGQLLLAWAAGG